MFAFPVDKISFFFITYDPGKEVYARFKIIIKQEGTHY